jgi:hypothetical protein
MKEQLFGFLRRRVGDHGLALVHESVLLNALGTTSKELSAALDVLASAGDVEVLSKLPYLVVRVHSWSGSKRPGVIEKQQDSRSPAHALDVPVSSSIAAAATNSSRDGGAGEGEALLDQVLATLGPEADPEEFRLILEGRSPVVIRQALRRVQATTTIRVSRAALFRSLLTKLS